MGRHCQILGIGLLAALIGLTLSGCKPARMDEGQQLQEQAQDLTVQGRGAFDQDFRFGPYAVTGIRRDWTERTAWGVFGFQDAQARQRFEFRLAGASDWVGHCATGLDEKTLRGLVGERSEVKMQLASDTTFVGTFTGAPGRTWRMVLTRATGEQVMKGFLTDEETTLRVEGTRKLAGTSMPLGQASGYFFSQGDVQLGAVDVINDGRVLLAPTGSTATREAVACAASALLLFQDLSEFR